MHLWSGLVAGPLLLVLALSGTVPVFRGEIEEALSRPPAVASGGASPRPLDAIVGAARLGHPTGEPRALRFPDRPEHPYRIELFFGPRRLDVAVDPYTLRVAGTGARGMAAYAAAKAGVTALTQSLGAEWAKYGITVNAVAPGPVETEGVLDVWKTPAMIASASREVPLQRLGRPEEIAWAVIFVASDQANFMTGETVYVSGGPRVANRED